MTRMVSMRAEAARVNNLMQVQKITVTKNVTKCLHLLDLLKKDQNSGSSPLLVQSASEVITFHGRTTDQLNRLEGNMQRFLDLSVQTFTGDDESELDRKIEDISTQMDKYTKTVDCIRTNNIENFRHIQHILHPPTSLRENPPDMSNPRFPCR